MIKLYDSSLALVAILQNAFNISYEKRLNEIWKAGFSLPFDDPKNSECTSYRFVEIFDGDERVDLFRILPSSFNRSGGTKVVSYECEHVLSTLLDDLLFQYNQRTGYTITQNISFVLASQSVSKWVVNTVDFTDVIDYKWENENLLSALFSIPKALSGDFQWTWDTTVYPWKLNLIAPSSTPSAQIRYAKNLVGITKQEDPSYIITRLYPLGYGEGVNQLDIKSVNSGVAYIDASTVGTYGVIASTFISKETESAQTLKDLASAYLETVKSPRIVYTVEGADIFSITNDSIDDIRDVGTYVSVIDTDLGTINARIVSVIKSDLTGNPGAISIEISNKLLDSSDQTASIESKQHINDVYAQGATNIDSNDYQDNCDNTHPATVEFYIPNECVRINKCLLTYKTNKFRAYETSAASGGSAITSSGFSGAQSTEVAISTATLYTGSSGGETHVHSYSIDHSHSIPLAQHLHIVTIPAHVHDLIYGIYEFGYLPPSLVIKVDGNTIPITALTGTDIDIVPYLASTGGIVNRGVFHKVEIFPNTDGNNPSGLARITACVTKQIFIQSRGAYTV